MDWQILQDNKHSQKFALVASKKINQVILDKSNNIWTITVHVFPQAFHLIELQLRHHFEFGLNSPSRVISNKYDQFSCCLSVDKASDDILARFLNEMQAFDPQLKALLPKINAFFYWQDEAEVQAELQQKLQAEGFKLALNYAKALYKKGFNQALHTLAKLCFNEQHYAEGTHALSHIGIGDKRGHDSAAQLCADILEKHYE